MQSDPTSQSGALNDDSGDKGTDWLLLVPWGDLCVEKGHFTPFVASARWGLWRGSTPVRRKLLPTSSHGRWLVFSTTYISLPEKPGGEGGA